MDLRAKIQAGRGTAYEFQYFEGLLYCYRNRVKRRWFVVPASLKRMVLQYIQDSVYGGYLGSLKTLLKVAANFYWPKMRSQVFKYVQNYELCQRDKQAQKTALGFHSASPVSSPMERVFIDFKVRLKEFKARKYSDFGAVRWVFNVVKSFPTRRIISKKVCDRLVRNYFPASGTPSSVVTDNAKAFCSKNFKDLCFRWGITRITTTSYILLCLSLNG